MFPEGHSLRAAAAAHLGWWTFWLTAGTCLTPTMGHETLSGFIQHHVVVAPGAEYLDVTVHLTFFEDGSQHEREQMDTDGDGSISHMEADTYLRRLQHELAAAVRLRIDGRPVRLTMLREPELDLLGSTHTGRWHHRLSLHWFTATPAGLEANAELVVEDNLWLDWPALGRLEFTSRDGARLQPKPWTDSLLPPARAGKPRLFEFRVLTPPRHPPTKASENRSL